MVAGPILDSGCEWVQVPGYGVLSSRNTLEGERPRKADEQSVDLLAEAVDLESRICRPLMKCDNLRLTLLTPSSRRPTHRPGTSLAC